jgi:hypothetical protein
MYTARIRAKDPAAVAIARMAAQIVSGWPRPRIDNENKRLTPCDKWTQL